jgi:hypothetical protein
MTLKVARRVVLPGAGPMQDTLTRRDQELATAINRLADTFDGATLQLTTNTNLRITVIGSDAVARHVDLTLAP